MRDDQFILDPTASASAATVAALKMLGDLRGKVIGFIDNAKPNFNLLAEDLGALLVARYGAKGVVTHRKRAASMPAPAEVIADVDVKCDLVIAGSGD